ncbi:long-chain fatty acid--CoA ligase [Alcanivorax sp. N3-2A]|nr:long-chain fatty acid--CoA ligase [Alcanivorax sp. N3-2A]|tara:strand:- start:12933 stop:14462 length:1530 start_codon:yes stop_codon:yes gene_type:complete
MSGAARLIAGERVVGFDQVGENSERAASGFRGLGIGEGDCVALFLRNDVAFFEATQGALLVGAYPVPMNWHSTPDEAGYILNDCQAKALLVHRDLLPQVAPVLPAGITVLVVETPAEIERAYRADISPANPPGAHDWHAWLARQPRIDNPVQATRAAVIYTSGTTGRPKGVKRQAAAPDAPPTDAVFAYGFQEPPPFRVLMNGPMYHSAPNGYARLAVQHGADIVLQARFDAEEMLALIERHRITHMHIVPTMFVRLLRLPEAVRQRYDVSSLRFVVHGAAPCPPHVKRAMIDWWGPVINEYYGSTESGLAAWNNAEDALLKPGTVGRRLPGAEIHVFADDGTELGPGETGEIYLRCGGMPDFTYIGLEDKRAEISRGELITLGDMGWLDEDGYLFLCDRKRDMIISGGVNIYPAEIEAALLALEGIKDCAVFGIPDEEFGEAICAYLEPMPGADLQPERIKEELADTLSRFKIPRHIEFAEHLPREDSGKIFKRKLREPYWAEYNRGV